MALQVIDEKIFEMCGWNWCICSSESGDSNLTARLSSALLGASLRDTATVFD